MFVFPEGLITREIKVGPAYDLQSGAPFSIHVMVAPTRTLVWGGTGDPLVAKLKTYIIPAGVAGAIELPVTSQSGFETASGEQIQLTTGEHAFGYKVTIFYLRNGSTVRTFPARTFVLPSGSGPVDVDSLVTFNQGNAGKPISTPDVWSAQIAAAQAAAEAASDSATEALAAVEELEGSIGTAVEEWFEDNSTTVVSPTVLQDAIDAHKEEPTPHKAYDLDIPSLTVLFENGLA